MLDRQCSNRPERRSAIIAHKLCNYDIDIAALSEVRWPESGHFKEDG